MATETLFDMDMAAREVAARAHTLGNGWWQAGDASQWSPRRCETGEGLAGADRLLAALSALSCGAVGGWWYQEGGRREPQSAHPAARATLPDGTVLAHAAPPRTAGASAPGPRELQRLADALLADAGPRVLVGGTRHPMRHATLNAVMVPAGDAWGRTGRGLARLVLAIAGTRLERDDPTADLVAGIACAFALADLGVDPEATGPQAIIAPTCPREPTPAWARLVDGHGAGLADCASRADAIASGMTSPVRADDGATGPPAWWADVAREGRRPAEGTGRYTLGQAMRDACAASSSLTAGTAD